MMSRKHENFTYDYGFRLAPEQWYFYLNGKGIKLDTNTRSSLAQLVLSGNVKKAEDELKRILRKEEKQPTIIRKCVGFYEKDSSEFYFTRDLSFDPNNLNEALYSYKEWKRYIESRGNTLETVSITTGYLDHNMKMTGGNEEKPKHVIDLTKGLLIRLTRNKDDVCFTCTL